MLNYNAFAPGKGPCPAQAEPLANMHRTMLTKVKKTHFNNSINLSYPTVVGVGRELVGS